MNKEEFAKRVTLVREAVGLNQKDFAECLGISDASMSDIEKGKGKNTPCIYFFYNIAVKFNVNLDYLITGKKEMFNNVIEEFIEQEEGKPYLTAKEKSFLQDFKNSEIIRSSVLAFWEYLVKSGIKPGKESTGKKD